MYYERKDAESPWKPIYKKSALFNKTTHPIESVPPEFWNADRKQSTPDPEYNSATHVLSNPQELESGTVGRVAVKLTDEELADNLQKERAGMILTPWQFRKAINSAGKRSIVETALSSMTQDEQDGWHVASSFERLNPLVIKLGGELLGYNDNQLDNFFRNAATL